MALTTELYLGRITVEGLAGVDSGGFSDNALYLFGASRNQMRFTDQLDLVFYPTDNWRISVGQQYYRGLNSIDLKTEFQLPLDTAFGISLFGEGLVGEHGYRAILARVKYYFGDTSKPLIRRQREDDPPIYLADDFVTL